jgi:hypothetical protein
VVPRSKFLEGDDDRQRIAGPQRIAGQRIVPRNADRPAARKDAGNPNLDEAMKSPPGSGRRSVAVD